MQCFRMGPPAITKGKWWPKLSFLNNTTFTRGLIFRLMITEKQQLTTVSTSGGKRVGERTGEREQGREGERERERERDGHRERQTDRQRQTERDRQTEAGRQREHYLKQTIS